MAVRVVDSPRIPGISFSQEVVAPNPFANHISKLAQAGGETSQKDRRNKQCDIARFYGLHGAEGSFKMIEADMAIDVFQPFTNPVSGETFKCLSSDEQAYVFEWTVQSTGYIPFEHVHLHQNEVFHVKKGEVEFLIDGELVVVRAGETATVTKGQRHIAFNNQNSIMQCIVEFRPGLDTLTGFQCFAGLTLDGEYDKQGRISFSKMGFFLKLMDCQAMTRPTNMPAPIFRLALNVFYMLGRFKGWKNDFVRYTGQER